MNRSITGSGNRETLKILQEIVPLQILEYPSGQSVYDWIIPKEWNIRDAWIRNTEGKKIVDFKNNNLHVVSYSRSIHEILSFEQLVSMLHYLKDLPSAIPYRTSYYDDTWGFCLSFNDFRRHFRADEQYEVFIDASFTDGYLTVGEILIPGKCSKEYLISTYICHPSMANDNLSGVVLTAFIAKELLKRDLNFSYRIIFVPETIGAITYCAEHEKDMATIDCGFIVSCVGGGGKFGYKKSFDESHFINKIIEETFQEDYIVYPFDIHGSDERQYSSPGFRINIASIFKDKYYSYEYYHTSLDDLSFVDAANISQSLGIYLRVINKLDKIVTFKRLIPQCEMMLSKYDLYPKQGGGLLPSSNISKKLDRILWTLFYCDGKHSVFDISRLTNLSIGDVYDIMTLLEKIRIIARS